MKDRRLQNAASSQDARGITSTAWVSRFQGERRRQEFIEPVSPGPAAEPAVPGSGAMNRN